MVPEIDTWKRMIRDAKTCFVCAEIAMLSLGVVNVVVNTTLAFATKEYLQQVLQLLVDWLQLLRLGVLLLCLLIPSRLLSCKLEAR